MHSSTPWQRSFISFGKDNEKCFPCEKRVLNETTYSFPPCWNQLDVSIICFNKKSCIILKEGLKAKHFIYRTAVRGAVFKILICKGKGSLILGRNYPSLFCTGQQSSIKFCVSGVSGQIQKHSRCLKQAGFVENFQPTQMSNCWFETTKRFGKPKEKHLRTVKYLNTFVVFQPWGHLGKKGMNLLEGHKKKGLKHLCCEDRLRDLKLFNLEKVPGDLIVALLYWKGAYK